MATLLCLACGLLAGLSTWLLLGDMFHSPKLPQAWLGFLARKARRVVILAAHSGVGLIPLHVPFLGSFAKELQEYAGKRGHVFSREESGVALFAAFVLIGVAGTLLARSIAGAIALPFAFGLWLMARDASRRKARERALAESMPGVLRTMASALEAGQTLVQVVEFVGLHEHGEVARPFARASLRLRCGMSMDQALDGLRGELPVPGMDLMVTALSISQRTGSPLRDLLQSCALLVEQQSELERMLAVRTAQARLSARIVCGLPVAIVILLALISPDFQQGIASVPGRVSLGLATCMDVAALLIIRRILGGVLS